MTKTLRYAAVTAALLAAGTIPAAAQAAPDFEQFDNFPPPATAPAQKKAAAPSGPSIAGAWAGQISQVDTGKTYQFEITVTGTTGTTRYPDLNCTGKLTRIGASKSYAFFIEIITEGNVDKGGRCPDGTITVARQGDRLALGWFGSIKESTIVAYGTLARKAGR